MNLTIFPVIETWSNMVKFLGVEPGMEKAHDTIYITNLPDTVTEEKLAEVFGSIGIIKMDRKTEKPKSNEATEFFHNGSLNTNYCINLVWIYTDKATGKPKGDGKFIVVAIGLPSTITNDKH